MSVRSDSLPPPTEDSSNANAKLLRSGQPSSLLTATESPHAVAFSSQKMATNIQDFRASADWTKKLDKHTQLLFETGEEMLKAASSMMEGALQLYGSGDAMEVFFRAMAVVNTTREWLLEGKCYSVEAEDEQSPWMGACASYLRKAKHYWHGEENTNSGELRGSMRKLPTLIHHAVVKGRTTSLPTSSNDESAAWLDGAFASWLQSGRIEVVRGQEHLHTFALIPSKETRELGDLKIFKPMGHGVPESVSSIPFHPPSQDVLLRVADKDGLKRWIVVATRCPLVAREA